VDIKERGYTYIIRGILLSFQANLKGLLFNIIIKGARDD
jgi:hypothetical protein